MQNIRVFFDGIEQDADEINGSNSGSFTFRSKQENGENGFSFSPELSLYGSAFDYVRTKIINAAIPQLEQIEVLILEGCCADTNGQPIVLFEGKIDGNDVEWCELPCNSCTVSIIDNSQDAKAIQCMKNTVIWDRKPKFDGSGLSGGEDSFRPANFVSYCIDVRPGFLQEILMVIGLLFVIAIAPTLLLIGTIVTLVNVFAVLLGQTPIGGDVNFYDDAFSAITLLQELIVGCGFKHKSPFIHSYITNVCDVCGLSFQSTIFGTGAPYHNTMRLDAQYSPGKKINSRVLQVYDKNKPNLNGLQLLEELKQFNLDWRVNNGVLILERKDFEFSGNWFDLADIESDRIISLCFTVTSEKPAAYGEYEYSKDGVDNTGDEVINGWTELVFDWNTPPSPAQAGLKRTVFFHGAAQFRNDSRRDEVSALDKPFYNATYPVLASTTDVLLMEKGVVSFSKLLMWDGISAQDNAKVLRYPSSVGSNLFDYNIDWWTKLDYVDGAGAARDTLYQRLLYIDNPRTLGVKQRGYTLEITASCDLIQTISPDKTIIIPVGGVSKTATITEISYNTNDYKLTISGFV